MLRIVKRDPFFPILSLFDEFVKNSATDEIKSENESVTAMALDLSETEKDYRVIANLPGIKKEDVKLSVEKNQLTIEASHKKEEESDKATYHHRERFFGKYHRIIYLPDNVDTNNIKAKMENGLLELSIPKEAAKPQTLINIE
jgi:HSP20 family protein